MPEYAIKIVDAFTTVPLTGNPCGVVTRAAGLSDAAMQQIAQELNLSETAFVLPSPVADFRVRFFTPRQEIPLAGHPTIATWHALADDGMITLDGGARNEFHQELAAGILPVTVESDANGTTSVLMTQATPVFGALLEPAAVVDALGIAREDLREDAPPQVVSTGTLQAMVPVRSLDVLKRLRPDSRQIEALDAIGGHVGTHVFALDPIDPTCTTHARHFAPSLGITEDPVTGSASGGMAAYLWKYGLFRKGRFRAEQGHLMRRPGIVDIEVEADGESVSTVRVGGRAVTVLQGTIRI